MIPNMNVKLKNGGRKGMKMSIPEFVQRYKDFCKKIMNTQDYDDWWISDTETPVMYGNTLYRLQVILGERWVGNYKIKFDMENYDHESLGMTSTGIPYLATWYGGDWEVPMVVFYYFDDKGKLRNYIPTKGNTYNTITKTAFGSENYADNYKSLCQRYNCDEEGLMILALQKGGISVQQGNDILKDIHYDINACVEDFESRVL